MGIHRRVLEDLADGSIWHDGLAEIFLDHLAVGHDTCRKVSSWMTYFFMNALAIHVRKRAKEIRNHVNNVFQILSQGRGLRKSLCHVI